MKQLIFLLSFSLLIASCGNEVQRKRVSNKVDQNGIISSAISNRVKRVFDTNTDEFLLRGTHARLLRTQQGTRIHVPANAFVNTLTGDAVQGDVVITFDEYHTQGEILASGIPMKYTTPEGNTVDFESAGMFEIRAFQEGTALELAPGKEIEVELATDAGGTFEFYAFDEGNENWTLQDTACDPIPNPYIAKQKMELERLDDEMPETPKKLIEYNKGDPLFDVKRYGSDDEAMDALNGVFWMFTGDSTQVDPSKDNVTFNKQYRFVELQAVDSSNVREYDMVFRDSQEEVIVRAAPIFQGKLLTRENDRMARILDQIEYALRSKAEIEKQLEQEKSLMRMMNIDGMGIYNYDIQLKDPRAVDFVAEFTFDGKSLDKGFAVYLLPREKHCVIKYDPLTMDQFRINPFETNRLMAISPENDSVYIMSSQDIKTLGLIRRKPGGKVVFDLKLYGEPIKNSQEVDDLLATL